MSAILTELKNELESLYAALGRGNKYSRNIPVILGSPRLWLNESMAAISGKVSPPLKYSGGTFDSLASENYGKQNDYLS
ncbi:hypothetical protein Tco_0295899 [Tanacetum coccineum]